MGINLTVLEGLPGNLRQQLEDFVNQLGVNLSVEHEDDGTHKSITGRGNIYKGGWGTFHGQLRCRVGLTAQQVIANGQEPTILWQDPLHSDATAPDDFYDNGSLYSTGRIYQGPANGWFLPPEEGNYLFTVALRWPAAGAGQYQVMIRSGLDEVAKVTVAASPGVNVSTFVSCVVPFPPPDTVPIVGALQRTAVTVAVFQSTGADVVTGGASSSNHCSVIKLS